MTVLPLLRCPNTADRECNVGWKVTLECVMERSKIPIGGNEDASLVVRPMLRRIEHQPGPKRFDGERGDGVAEAHLG